MQTRSLLFAAAAAALALAGCDQSDFAKELLEKDGYTDIAVKKDGDHHYAFTAKKSGQSCSGSMEIKGNRQNYESSTNVTCGP
ncbi:MAG TPA: hypothetical protein VL400_03060 [Polyangiaceae bacterium]|jgi:hypothetical protein|nr:hypothetical protein [Polyangiaceae bacterium]